MKKKHKHAIHFLGLKIPTPHAQLSHTCFSVLQKIIKIMLSHSYM